MKISIIIPTYNEEKYLPKLLDSIKSQNFDDYEIIVADANSNDQTREIAIKYGCEVVDGGLPAVGRNNGAKIAKGELLLFLDSDLQLTPNYLEKIIEEFEEYQTDIGITLMTPMSESNRDKLLHDIANWFMIAFEKIKPHGAGCYGIITKKDLHIEHEGFDEKLSFGEDTDYIERLSKYNNFKVLKEPKIYVSTRRLEEEGLVTLIRQYGKSTLNDLRGKRTSAEDLGYEFGHGPKEPIDEYTIIKKIKETQEIIDETNESSNKTRSKKPILVVDTDNSHEILSSADEINYDKIDKPIIDESDEPIRIIYSVCGEGMGHAVRSGVILEELIKKYEVMIFSSERAYKYLNEKFDNVYEIGGFNTVYENNEVKNTKTLFNAIKETPSHLREGYGILFKNARKFRPHIIISDFENYSSTLSKIINIPLISIGNIPTMTKTKIEYPPDSQREMLKAKGIVRSYILHPQRYILTSFFFPEIKDPKKTVIYPPIIRDKIRNLETSYEDYVLVYQTSAANEKLVNTLKGLDEKFIIYGFNKEEKDDNLTFRKFNEDQIYEDMKDAKAVLTNGGFTFITEAITLKKPIFSIPAKGNFEQLLNGFYVDKLGYGKMYRDLDIDQLQEFLNNLEEYRNTLSQVKSEDNSKIIKEIKESIENYPNY